MTIFIDTNGEMDFADNERLYFVMHFLKLGSDPDVLEIRNNRFVREDAETSFQEIWLPCATAKQKEIDDLKAELEKAKAKVVPDTHIVVPRNREVVVAIEKMVEQQVEASGITSDVFRLDGWRILDAIQEASESGAEG
ncbi:hypothetical protein [Acinetobacter sp. 8_A20231192]|uniref:hypothetical protein n=1 Tax=Acinetobacter sp. 8_A20231192 TaxID=3141545 RepID=UPI0032094FB2